MLNIAYSYHTFNFDDDSIPADGVYFIGIFRESNNATVMLSLNTAGPTDTRFVNNQSGTYVFDAGKFLSMTIEELPA
ncbi:MAG: hypothetical protein FWF37_04595 [Chloroflexi bacterium]|nr:hypothetical protein [Chloroflexota bacterium]